MLTGLIAGLEDGEHAVAMVCAKAEEMAAKGDLLFITKNGMVKRTAAAEYAIRRARFAAINLKGDDELVGLTLVDPAAKGDLILVTRSGMGIRFKLDSVSATGRATAGVKGIALEEEDAVQWFVLPKAGDVLLVVTDRGFGKRMLADDIERQGRAGKGQKLMPITKNGVIGLCLAACAEVAKASGVVFEQKMGYTTTLSIHEIPMQRRSGKGEMLVSVLLDDVVVNASVRYEAN